MQIQFSSIPTAVVRSYQSGGLDANGHAPERHLSGGGSTPCRHCLKPIAKGAEMLNLAHRPFPRAQPYAEIGPIFLCASYCAPGDKGDLPEILTAPDYIIRAYGADDRIIYGTGAVVPTVALRPEAAARLADDKVAYVHIRSSHNNCFQVRVDRA
jgi:hypothetical protein